MNTHAERIVHSRLASRSPFGRFTAWVNARREARRARRIDVWLGRGGVVEISVNGHSLGKPGKRTATYAESFGPLDYRRKPSANSSPGH